MRGKFVYISLFVAIVIFVFVLYVALSTNLFGGVMEAGGIMDAFTGIRDKVTRGALGGTVDPLA